MEKFPFTAAGFNALQLKFYALTDQLLMAEAEYIKDDFDDWMAANFELSNKQLLFLAAIDARLHALLASLTYFAVSNRLPVVLRKADPPADGDEQGKIIWPKSNLTATWSTNNAYLATGALEIHIAYQN